MRKLLDSRNANGFLVLSCSITGQHSYGVKRSGLGAHAIYSLSTCHLELVVWDGNLVKLGMFLGAIIISAAPTFLLGRTDILRFPLLEWAESTVAEFNSDSAVGRTIRLHIPNRLGRTIRRCGPNPSWAEPSGTRCLRIFFGDTITICDANAGD